MKLVSTFYGVEIFAVDREQEGEFSQDHKKTAKPG